MDPEATAIQKIQNTGNRPEDWLELLARLRARAGPELTDEACRHLVFLYERAVKQISPEENKINFSYARLLVECAKLQMRISEDDARRTFQLARSNAKHFAIVFVAWAQFELSLGNKSKCRGLLRKGKDFGAQPIDLLLKAYDNFVEGKKVLIDDCDELTLTGFNRVKQKSSESSVDSSPLSTGDDTSTGSRFTDTGTSKVEDNTSAVISFKLPSVLESCGKQPLSCRRSNSSSSSDEADTIPLQHGQPSHRQKCSMSTQKPSVKSTPDFRSATNSLASSMNLSVRRNKTRRGPRGAVGDFGLPIRVKMTLPSVKEPGDDLDGITELDTTVDEPQQGCKPEMASSTQGTHSTDGSMRTTSSTSKKDIETVQKPPTGTSHSATHNQAQSKENGTRENLFMLQTADSVVSNQRQNSSIQDVSQSITANPPSATLNNSRSHHKNSSQQQPETWSSQQRKFQAQQVPGPQTLTAPSANSVTGGSSTIRRENSSSITPVVNNSGSFLQHHTPFSHSGQLHANPGQLPGVGFTPGYPPEMQFINPVVPVASQVSQGTIVVNGKSYQKLSTIGKGGSSKVYQAFDGKRICAIKYVNLEEADDFIVQSYINEISLLKRLQGNDNIIKLYDWELSQEKSAIILVMECGSIDLAGFLRKNRAKITEGELQGFWRQMLEAVHVIHQQGIIHSDLKPANFLLVEGRLKLIDFGIARTLQEDKTSIELDTQVGTLNFMSPEAFQDISHAPRFDSTGRNAKPRMKIGRPSDVWSLGCILYMMVYGRTPFQHITNHVIKLQCIMDPSHEIEFPDIKDKHLLDVMKGCLRRNPKERYNIPHLLAHPFIYSSSHNPLVEIEDKMFDCLMEFAKTGVNSPRSIRAVSQNLCKQLLAGNKISISSAVPSRPLGPEHFQQAVQPRQAAGPGLRQPLVGIDVQALNQAQKGLKPPHASGNDKYMKWNTNEQNKENADLNVVLKRELAEKYRNAIPFDMSESTFEQTWNTTTGR